MGLNTNISEQRIKAYISKCESETNKAICMFWAYVGEISIKYARSLSADNSFIDRTGNLRSSETYCVFHNGSIVSKGSYSAISSQGAEGKQQGDNYVEQIARQLSKANNSGVVIGAGMQYASFVESRENKIVLSTANSYMLDFIQKNKEKLAKQIADIYTNTKI